MKIEISTKYKIGDEVFVKKVRPESEWEAYGKYKVTLETIESVHLIIAEKGFDIYYICSEWPVLCSENNIIETVEIIEHTS